MQEHAGKDAVQVQAEPQKVRLGKAAFFVTPSTSEQACHLRLI